MVHAYPLIKASAFLKNPPHIYTGGDHVEGLGMECREQVEKHLEQHLDIALGASKNAE